MTPILERLRQLLRQFAASSAGKQARDLLERLRPYYEQMRARYQKLEPREKMLVRIAAVVLGIFVAWDLFYLPIRGWREDLDARVRAQQRELAEVQRLVDRYARLKASLVAAERRTVPGGRDFSLFSVLEHPLTQALGPGKNISISPAPEPARISPELMQFTAAVKLDDLTLEQIVSALYAMDTLPVPVTVTSMSIKRRSENPHSYDVDLTCSALQKNG